MIVRVYMFNVLQIFKCFAFYMLKSLLQFTVRMTQVSNTLKIPNKLFIDELKLLLNFKRNLTQGPFFPTSDRLSIKDKSM